MIRYLTILSLMGSSAYAACPDLKDKFKGQTLEENFDNLLDPLLKDYLDARHKSWDVDVNHPPQIFISDGEETHNGKDNSNSCIYYIEGTNIEFFELKKIPNKNLKQ